MTFFVGGSILLIAAAAITLVLGWVTADESLIWTSIGASVVAGVFLALGYARSKHVAAAETGEGSGQPAEAVPAAGTTSVAGFGTAGAPSEDGEHREVVAVAERRKYHRPDCRYAKVTGAERMPEAIARRRSYDPCSICNP